MMGLTEEEEIKTRSGISESLPRSKNRERVPSSRSVRRLLQGFKKDLSFRFLQASPSYHLLLLLRLRLLLSSFREWIFQNWVDLTAWRNIKMMKKKRFATEEFRIYLWLCCLVFCEHEGRGVQNINTQMFNDKIKFISLMRSSARTEPLHFLLFPTMKSSQCMKDAVVFNDENRIRHKMYNRASPSPRDSKAPFAVVPAQWIHNEFTAGIYYQPRNPINMETRKHLLLISFSMTLTWPLRHPH